MIGLMWYLMGMLTMGAVWGYVNLNRQYRLNLIAKLSLAAVFALFGIWADQACPGQAH